MRTVMLIIAYAIAAGFPVQAAHAAQPGDEVLVVNPRINPCIESAGNTADRGATIRRCEGLLGLATLSDDDKSVLHGILGVAYFERAVSRVEPGDTSESLARSLTAESKQDIRVSIQHYSAALQAKPNSPIADRNYWHRGFDKELLGQIQEALSDFNQVIRLKPDFFKGYLSRARMLARLGKRDQARADLNRAFHLAPYDPEVLNTMKAMSGGAPERK